MSIPLKLSYPDERRSQDVRKAAHLEESTLDQEEKDSLPVAGLPWDHFIMLGLSSFEKQSLPQVIYHNDLSLK